MVTKEEIQARIAALKEKVSKIRTVKHGDYVLSSDYNLVASCMAEAADILSQLPIEKVVAPPPPPPPPPFVYIYAGLLSGLSNFYYVLYRIIPPPLPPQRLRAMINAGLLSGLSNFYYVLYRIIPPPLPPQALRAMVNVGSCVTTTIPKETYGEKTLIMQ